MEHVGETCMNTFWWKNGKRQLGKQRHRWENNIKTNLQKNRNKGPELNLSV